MGLAFLLSQITQSVFLLNVTEPTDLKGRTAAPSRDTKDLWLAHRRDVKSDSGPNVYLISTFCVSLIVTGCF